MSLKEIEDKEAYLKANYPFGNVPELTDQKHCVHCGEDIVVGEYKVGVNSSDVEYILCSNAPKCDGTVIDWLSIDK